MDAGLSILNTPMLGAFAAATGEIRLETVIGTIRKEWPGAIGEKNAEGAAQAYKKNKQKLVNNRHRGARVQAVQQVTHSN